MAAFAFVILIPREWTVMIKHMLLLLCALLSSMGMTSLVIAEEAIEARSLAGKRVAFLGDSNTQAGTYVSLTAYFLEKEFPGEQFEIYGLGLASETLSGLSEPNHAGGAFPRPCLFERLGRVLEKLKPEIVFACYGMNDGIYLPLENKRFLAFQEGVKKLIEQCQSAGVKKIILVTPPLYDFPPGEQGFNYDSVLTAYAEWEMSIKTPGVQVVDLHTPMMKSRAGRKEAFSNDRVHPGEEGHLFMARTLLAALKVKTSEETLATIKADPLFQQVDQLRQLRSGRWMQHIGYTREKTVEPQPLGTTESDAAKIREKINGLRRAM